MPELSDRIIYAALERGRLARETEPRAAAARYDAPARRVVVELTKGCTLTFPPALAQGLEQATDAELEAIEIPGQGYGLHWEALNVDLSLPGLMAGIFGTKAYMARRAGQVTSPAKAIASRINGAKGGRPRKSANS